MIPSEGTQSPNVPEYAYDQGDLFVGPSQNMPEMELQAEDIVRREDLDTAMEQDLAGERPAVALQVSMPCGALTSPLHLCFSYQDSCLRAE